MDPFEEFEFKPLTDGLGFHKKKSSTPAKDEKSADSFSSTMIKNQGLELIEETSTDPLRPPLPRKKSSPIPQAPGSLTEVGGDGTATGAVDEILKTLQKNRHLDFESSKQKISQTTAKEEYKKTIWSFSAALLDGMLVIASSLLCMILLLVITKVDLIGNLTNPDAQGMIYLSTLAMFGGVAFIYLVLNRIYLGCTPGEWAFDQRIGKPEELNKAMFSLKVVARSFLVVATGLIVFPVLSLLFNKDMAGSITGAQLYKKA
ncbi:metalloendopeptidase [Bdellovibrio sp. 22V]|uniref:RDD family protein n=1 Tax=Bdellovibrio sp. 22V TaxID=3044166 RepID=UPI0025428F4D|nr:RDD family protein [Bdellovibrio sp. 22V]WII73175.1 metalloendopeptidase [Bdellovibrio sp. 22V]